MKGIGKSHIGKVRKKNEDAYSYSNGKPCYYIVADGMGGHKAGSTASHYAVEALTDHLEKYLAEDLSVREVEGILYQGMTTANKTLFDMSLEDEDYNGMGTTLTACIPVKDEKQVIIGHIGDSRAYLYDGTELQQLTKDHSLVEEMVRKGEITEEEALVHPKRNIITRALGTAEENQYDIFSVSFSFQEDHRLILCTDGLTNYVSQEEIGRFLREEKDPETLAEELVKLANERGGQDNITVLVFHGEVRGDESDDR